MRSNSIKGTTMRTFTLATLCMFAGGFAFASGQMVGEKADAIQVSPSGGYVELIKGPWPRPKDQSRIIPFSCEEGERDVMGMDGDVIGCEGRG